MDKIIKNNSVKGHIVAPPSKSLTIRAVAASSLCLSESVIYNYSKCNDAIAAIDIIKEIGSTVNYNDNNLFIRGGIPSSDLVLNCRESAFCLRLFSIITSLYDKQIELIAENSLRNRKTENIEDILKFNGVKCKTNNSYPPIYIKGPIKGGKFILDCSQSSQILSGLLFTLPLAESDSTIEVTNLKSKPYIDMTLDIFFKFGIDIQNYNYELFKIKCGQNYKPADIKIEGDWSCSSNFLVAGAINGEIEIGNLNINSMQGDKVIIDLLSSIGVEVKQLDNSIKVLPYNLMPFNFDAGDCPDLVPILTVLGCFCDGESFISDVSRLAGKESSRAETIANELNSIGAKIKLEENCLRIEKTKLLGGRVNSHGDHRIAMALAIAGLSASEPLTIKNAECVSKSYPLFWEDFDNIVENSEF
ncbi:MAG: 3-phosphoshikimate 1-carboxyvinyltransferase [Ignavibacteriae bacterium]|nr:3-phosphoshikimate 1-carboxyvinyltransferase [Ignavibacteriota bacterium]